MGLGPAEDEGRVLPLPRRNGGKFSFALTVYSRLTGPELTRIDCIQAALKRTLAFSDVSDLLWLETKAPDLKQAQTFARVIREKNPNKYVGASLHSSSPALR